MASVIKTNAEGIIAMFDEGSRRNPDGARKNVVLLDGDENQLANVEAEAKERGCGSMGTTHDARDLAGSSI